jgi:hypothetical protein
MPGDITGVCGMRFGGSWKRWRWHLQIIKKIWNVLEIERRLGLTADDE